MLTLSQVANSTSVSISLPTIGRELNVPQANLFWLLSAYPLSSVSPSHYDYKHNLKGTVLGLPSLGFWSTCRHLRQEKGILAWKRFSGRHYARLRLPHQYNCLLLSFICSYLTPSFRGADTRGAAGNTRNRLCGRDTRLGESTSINCAHPTDFIYS